MRYALSPRRRYSVRHDVILGLRAVVVTIEVPKRSPRTKAERVIDAVIKELRRLDVKKIVFRGDFAYKEAFLSKGFSIPDSYELQGRLLPSLVQKFPCEGKSALICSGSLDRTTAEALGVLCERFRYVYASVGRGADSVFEDMRARLGISVLDSPRETQLSGVNLAIFVDSPERQIRLPPECIAVFARRNAKDNVVYNVAVSDIEVHAPGAEGIPDGYDTAEVILLALMAGAIDRESVTISAVNFTKM